MALLRCITHKIRLLIVSAIMSMPLVLQGQEDILLEKLLASVPTAPPGVSIPPLPEQAVRYETGEGLDITVKVVATGLNHPWGFLALPDGSILVTERNSGLLRLIRDDVMSPEPIAGLPEIRAGGYTGLLDIVMHPQFADNQQLYFAYNKPLSEDESAMAIARGVWTGKKLAGVEDIYVATAGVSGSSSLMFDHDGFLYASFYGSSMDSQTLSDLRGKVIRLTDEGKVPVDNPFINTADAQPEIYSFGHRTIQGMELHPETGEIWSLEMGPNGGDEINVLHAGGNYGWPLVSLGRDYAGAWQSSKFQDEGLEDPVVYWTPSISVSGMTFYNGDKFPAWQGSLFVGGLRMGELPGTGHLQRIGFNALGEEIRREMLLVDLRQRIRGAFQSIDGFIYVLVDEEDGAVLKIEPVTEN